MEAGGPRPHPGTGCGRAQSDAGTGGGPRQDPPPRRHLPGELELRRTVRQVPRGQRDRQRRDGGPAGRQGGAPVHHAAPAHRYGEEAAGARPALSGGPARGAVRCHAVRPVERADRRSRPPLLSGAVPDRRRQDGQVHRLERRRRARHEHLRCHEHAGGPAGPAVRAGRQLLPRRVRRIVPQPLLVHLRVLAAVARRARRPAGATRRRGRARQRRAGRDHKQQEADKCARCEQQV